MVNIDAVFPEEVIVTINGSTLTTYFSAFTETGGERAPAFRKTMSRGYKEIKSVPTDYVIEYQGTTRDLSIADLEDVGMNPMAISLSWTGSYVITYNEARNFSLTHQMTGEDFLKTNIRFTVPFYNNLGSKNRVIST